ncbi:MAG: MFS transporter [Sphingomonadales bacterium]|nr:MAG: MFS transporter [Sphingomonadales bacterium]
MTGTMADRRGIWAFALGCACVTAGVLMHVPMFLMGRDMHFMLAGMEMGWDMVLGMALIIGGALIAAYGLLPRNLAAQRAASEGMVVAAPEDAHLGPAHWGLMTVLVVALIIDTMKPAALGFTIDGMKHEYHVDQAVASLVPFFALIGTVTGSIVWGVLADIYGRKATILLSAVMFVGTSICGAMPSLYWNIGMCFMMGAAAGGMLPVTYALLAEMMPNKHRGWSLVLVGGLGAGGGYLAASAAATWLVPLLSWRVLWLLNLPTGLALVLLGVFIPESAKFLMARGRAAEAQRVMAKFGAVMRKDIPANPARPAHGALKGVHLYGKLTALSIAALSWGFVNFGLLLWLPAHLRDKGYSIEVANGLLAKSALIAIPMAFTCALIYSLWSTKWSLVASIGVLALGLLGVLRLELFGGGDPVMPFALLIIGINGIIAILLPYTAESFPLRVRGRATGWIAACTKAGGVIAQGLSITKLVPPIGIVAGAVVLPVVGALLLVAWFGRETRGGDLRDLDDAMDTTPV